jgi:hypothetical protein
LESGEKLSEVGAEGAGEGSNEVAGGSDEGSVVLGLLSSRHSGLIFVVVDLARRLALEDERNLLADGLNV